MTRKLKAGNSHPEAAEKKSPMPTRQERAQAMDGLENEAIPSTPQEARQNSSLIDQISSLLDVKLQPVTASFSNLRGDLEVLKLEMNENDEI